jgi:glycolate oxidase iron-sulfur subunit
VTQQLAQALGAQREELLTCVHCGFCLPACPTYNRLGDEADSPRGRLYLMRGVVEGRLDPASDAFRVHIDRCLGCRACEPVCPSGVRYGALLELAREVTARQHRPPVLTRLLLVTFGSARMAGMLFALGRAIRGLGLAALLSRILPARGLLGSARLGLGMLASSVAWPRLRHVGAGVNGRGPKEAPAAPKEPRGRVGILRGCVQEGLYGRVNQATRRVLDANGFEVVEIPGQGCCGALHAHGGALDEARRLARVNIARFEAADVDLVVVNAAGCGATMKEYGHLLREDPGFADRARSLSQRTRDLMELLAEVGPRGGGPLSCSVAYDHPCHLLHAQGVGDAPLAVLSVIPAMDVRVVTNASECCGGAGIYGMTHPELGGHIGRDKVTAVQATAADVASTPNPGCMMQIGAGLRLAGAPQHVVHPVELLDESYRRAGYYT